MSEKLGHIENHHDRHEAETSHEVPAGSEVLTGHLDKQAEARAKQDHEKRAREEIKKAHESVENEPAQHGTRAVHAPLHRLEPVAVTVARAWGTIRQSLSPSQKTFSKVIHNPVVSNISEATAKTLARPYALLSAGLVAVAGSSVYLYYTKHLGYKYNFFVPILLFLAGLVVGIIVEILYKLIARPHKK